MHFSFAQGREESYLARRDEFKVLSFPQRNTSEEVKSEKAKEGSKAIPKLNFEKEIRKMNIDSVLIHKILSEAVWVKGRKKTNGVYEIRLRRSGYNIQSPKVAF